MASLPPAIHASRVIVLFADCTSFEGEAGLFLTYTSRFENFDFGGDLCLSILLSSRGGVRLRSLFLLAGGCPQPWSDCDVELSPLESKSDEEGVTSFLVLPHVGDVEIRSLPALFLIESPSLFSLISISIEFFSCPARYAVKFAHNSCNCFLKSSLFLRCSPNSKVNCVTL